MKAPLGGARAAHHLRVVFGASAGMLGAGANADILAFLLKEGPSDKVQTLINQMPGAETAMAAAASDGGLGMGGIMGVGTKLMAAGLGMDQMQSVTRELIAYAREKAGEDTVGEIVGSIPGLGQFV